jgi:hypothetical protein
MSRFALCTARILAGVLVCVPLPAAAQTGSFGSGTAVGVTIQALETDEGILELPAVGLHVTVIGRSAIGVDFTISTIPNYVAAGAVWIAPDLGLARVLPVGGGALMIKGGASAVLIAGPDGGNAVWGGHVGLAAFVRLGNRFGIRAEIVPHLYRLEQHTSQLTTLGIGFTSLPARRR